MASRKVIVQQCILTLLEKSKPAFDSGQMFGALLTHLFKVFECLEQEQLIEELNA